ncbi:hypothetical protein [Flavobacterium sp. N2820]|nr:hypothetical protein [Flavobacterium sp. N2820]
MRAEYFKRKKMQAICNAIGELKKGATAIKDFGNSLDELNPAIKELTGSCYAIKNYQSQTRNVVPTNFYKRCHK